MWIWRYKLVEVSIQAKCNLLEIETLKKGLTSIISTLKSQNGEIPRFSNKLCMLSGSQFTKEIMEEAYRYAIHFNFNQTNHDLIIFNKIYPTTMTWVNKASLQILWLTFEMTCSVLWWILHLASHKPEMFMVLFGWLCVNTMVHCSQFAINTDSQLQLYQ